MYARLREQRLAVLAFCIVIILGSFLQDCSPPRNFSALLLGEWVSAAREPASLGIGACILGVIRGWEFGMIAQCEHTEAYGIRTAFRLPVKPTV